MRYILLFFILAASITSAPAQAPSDKKLSKSIDQLMNQKYPATEPGMSLLVARQGKLLTEKAWGMANLELSVPLHSDYVFRIGSVTKELTATATWQLIEQGKLSLDDSLQQYIPPFPPKGATIRVRHLLSHTAGIMDYMAKDHPDPFVMRHDLHPVELIAHIAAEPLLATPGSTYIYSNSNYVLLGLIIEKVSGMSYHDYVRRHILEPAGMTRSFFAAEKVVLPGRVSGYGKGEKGWENTSYQTLSLGYAAGDLLSTTGDLYRFTNALFQHRLLKQSTLQQALQAPLLGNGQRSHYAYGWMVDTIAGKLCYRHDGSVSGFGADIRYFPAEDVFLAFLINGRSDEGDSKARDIMTGVTRLVMGGPSRREVKLDEAAKQRVVGLYKANPESGIRITLEKGQVYMEGTNPEDKMTKMPVYPSSVLTYFVKGVPVDLEFQQGPGEAILQLVTTFNNQKRIEWKKTN